MITKTEMEKNINRYVRLGGRGILDGLKQKKNKFSFYRIIAVTDDELNLRSYRAKGTCFLHRFNWNQDFEIIDKKEFKALPTY